MPHAPTDDSSFPHRSASGTPEEMQVSGMGQSSPPTGASTAAPTAPVPSAAPTANAHDTRRQRREEAFGRPIRIGLLGTSGAGKTTYQTALAYVLVRQHETEQDENDPLFGNPVGQETKQFLGVRVQELIAGQFPLPTNEATNLFYRIETHNETKLVSIMDYRGGDLSEIYSRDDGQPLPETVRDIAEYFADCDGYIFLVNVRTLLMDESDPEHQRFWSEFLVYKEVLQYLIDTKPRFRKQISTPFALVASQTDAVDLEPKENRDRIDKALANLTQELSRHVRYMQTFLTSAIGNNFLDAKTGQKLPHARLEPKNVLAPVRFIMSTQRTHRWFRRRLIAMMLAIILIGGLAVGLGVLKFEAEMRLADISALSADIGVKQRILRAVREANGLFDNGTIDAGNASTGTAPERLTAFAERLTALAGELDDATHGDLKVRLASAARDLQALAANGDKLDADTLAQKIHGIEATLTGIADGARNLDELTQDQLLDRLRQVRAEQGQMGALALFLTEDGRRVFGRVRDQILGELDDREFNAFMEAASARPTNLEKIERLARDYRRENKHLDTYSNQRHTDAVAKELENARQRFDEELWADATRKNRIEAYENYLAEARKLPSPRYLQAAQERVNELRRDQFTREWDEIRAFAAEHPHRYDQTVPAVYDFLQRCPADVLNALRPRPMEFFSQRVAAWDEALWLSMETRFANSIDVQQGSIEAGLMPYLADLQGEYLNRISPYATPRHEAEANQRIRELRELAKEKEYKIRLVNGTFQSYDEDQPDVFVKVYVNGVIKLDTENAPKNDSANPVWNTDFTVRWKAYDRIKVEVWDQDKYLLVTHNDHIFEVEDAGLKSLRQILGGQVSYRNNTAFFAVTFQIINSD